MSPNTLLKKALKNLITPTNILITLLISLNLASAITVIFVKNQYRSLFIQLQQIKHQERKLNTQHSQLLLEDSTWKSQNRVEHTAHSNYDMQAIKPKNIKIINLKD